MSSPWFPALSGAAAVLIAGAAVQPRPVVRGPDPQLQRRRRRRPTTQRVPTVARVRRRGAAPIAPADVAEWCDTIARALRGGATLPHAIQRSEPPATLAGRLAELRLGLERGAPLSEALDSVAPRPHLDLALVVLRTCARLGGPAAEPIDRAAAALRQRSALAAERSTHSAQARLSAIVMTTLPGALLALLVVSSPAVRSALVQPAGLIVLVAGALLNVAGWAWMRRVIGALR